MESRPPHPDPFDANFKSRLLAALKSATARLLEERVSGAGSEQRHWTGELSSSALSTATAVTALAMVERASNQNRFSSQILSGPIRLGLEWLAKHLNPDGGWGDTTISISNLSTTALCWAAFGAVPGADAEFERTVRAAESWLMQRAGGTQRHCLARAIIASYGKDRTFSVPILTMCALAGRLGTGEDAWRDVISLPFELATCPHQWFAALRLPVVSYALPALIAVGQAKHYHRPSRNPALRLIRSMARQRTLKLLEQIQPSNGGFLEATPLTSFVVMSLAGSGQVQHPVTSRGAEFLKASQRKDGSWPIDTNLATWLTTLSINALHTKNSELPLTESEAGSVRSWLLDQQYRYEHPYTHAAAGGWAWTDLPGGVPDADDTAGALLALRALGPLDEPACGAAVFAIQWLLDLQNRDGGVPTFCRGWGALPFDRSSPDITAHALRSWLAWRGDLPPGIWARARRAIARALIFLARSQQSNGSWVPLWFGNQFAPDDQNPTYGTARVLCALAVLGECEDLGCPLPRSLVTGAIEYLVKSQNPDGGWGGSSGLASSTEETALALEGLAAAARSNVPLIAPSLHRGAGWLIQRIENGQWTEPTPMGFYFAKLWYYERLYPLIFTVGALNRVIPFAEGAAGHGN